MNAPPTRPADTWSPLYFLASLGAGGLAVTFFMFLMFWVPHPDQPVPVFEDIVAAFSQGSLPIQGWPSCSPSPASRGLPFSTSSC
jgi:hypothetical protein